MLGAKAAASGTSHLAFSPRAGRVSAPGIIAPLKATYHSRGSGPAHAPRRLRRARISHIARDRDLKASELQPGGEAEALVAGPSQGARLSVRGLIGHSRSRGIAVAMLARRGT